MTRAPGHEGHTERVPVGPGRAGSLPVERTAAAVMLGLAILAAGCGGSNNPGAAGSGLGRWPRGPRTARCMRSHGVPDFPDPTASPGGGVVFQVNGGPGSDLDHNNPTFQAADQECRSLLPGGGQAPPPSAQAGRGGGLGPLHALARPPGFSRPQLSGRVRQQQVRRQLARLPNRHQRLQVVGTDGTDERRSRSRERTVRLPRRTGSEDAHRRHAVRRSTGSIDERRQQGWVRRISGNRVRQRLLLGLFAPQCRFGSWTGREGRCPIERPGAEYARSASVIWPYVMKRDHDRTYERPTRRYAFPPWSREPALGSAIRSDLSLVWLGAAVSLIGENEGRGTSASRCEEFSSSGPGWRHVVLVVKSRDYQGRYPRRSQRTSVRSLLSCLTDRRLPSESARWVGVAADFANLRPAPSTLALTPNSEGDLVVPRLAATGAQKAKPSGLLKRWLRFRSRPGRCCWSGRQSRTRAGQNRSSRLPRWHRRPR